MITFITASHKPEVLYANLLKSPCVGEVNIIIQQGYTNISKAYNDAMKRELAKKATYKVFIHHDVYLPTYFLTHLLEGIEKIEETDKKWGVIGVAGAALVNNQRETRGFIADRGYIWGSPVGLPAEVQTLDEMLLIVRNGTLKFDENIPSTHFYGADLCLQALSKGMKNYAINAYCFHNSRLGMGERPSGFYEAEEYIRNKWGNLNKIVTTCAII